MEQSFQKGVVLHLASLIEYTEGGVISKQLIKSPAGNITLFSFDKGESIVMPAGLLHAVYGKEQFKMLLVVVF